MKNDKRIINIITKPKEANAMRIGDLTAAELLEYKISINFEKECFLVGESTDRIKLKLKPNDFIIFTNECDYHFCTNKDFLNRYEVINEE